MHIVWVFRFVSHQIHKRLCQKDTQVHIMLVMSVNVNSWGRNCMYIRYIWETASVIHKDNMLLNKSTHYLNSGYCDKQEKTTTEGDQTHALLFALKCCRSFLWPNIIVHSLLVSTKNVKKLNLIIRIKLRMLIWVMFLFCWLLRSSTLAEIEKIRFLFIYKMWN